MLVELYQESFLRQKEPSRHFIMQWSHKIPRPSQSLTGDASFSCYAHDIPRSTKTQLDALGFFYERVANAIENRIHSAPFSSLPILNQELEIVVQWSQPPLSDLQAHRVPRFMLPPPLSCDMLRRAPAALPCASSTP